LKEDKNDPFSKKK